MGLVGADNWWAQVRDGFCRVAGLGRRRAGEGRGEGESQSQYDVREEVAHVSELFEILLTPRCWLRSAYGSHMMMTTT